MSSHDEKTVRAMMILDIIGRPPEYLVQMLDNVIKDMADEKGVKVISSNVKEPTFMKDNKEFYTTFAEVEVETEDIMYLAVLMFKFMPAHIEIISPETINLSNNEMSDILSELIRRLHAYDEVVRITQIEKQELIKKIQELGGKIVPGQGIVVPEKPEEKTKEKAEKKPRKKKK